MQNMRRVPACGMARMGNAGYAAPRMVAPIQNGSRDAEYNHSCPGVDCLSGTPSLAMVYVPCQSFTDLYELDEGMKNGTIFRALNMPFQPGYGKRGDVR